MPPKIQLYKQCLCFFVECTTSKIKATYEDKDALAFVEVLECGVTPILLFFFLSLSLSLSFSFSFSIFIFYAIAMISSTHHLIFTRILHSVFSFLPFLFSLFSLFPSLLSSPLLSISFTMIVARGGHDTKMERKEGFANSRARNIEERKEGSM